MEKEGERKKIGDKKKESKTERDYRKGEQKEKEITKMAPNARVT